MKTSGHLILYISENDDYELWRVLSQISPEDRAAFVKTALKKALSQGSDSRNNANWLKQNNVFRMEKNGADGSVAEIALEELGYNTLAATEEKIKPFKYFEEDNRSSEKVSPMLKQNSQDDAFDLADLGELEILPASEIQHKTSLPGLDFLLSNVIGEEDDEKVIEFIKRKKSQ